MAHLIELSGVGTGWACPPHMAYQFAINLILLKNMIEILS